MTSTLKLATAAVFGLAAFAASDASAFTYHTSSALRLRPTSQPTVSRPVARSLTSSTAAKLAPYTIKGAGAAKLLVPNSGAINHSMFPGVHYTPPVKVYCALNPSACASPPAQKILVHYPKCLLNPSACASPPPLPGPPPAPQGTTIVVPPASASVGIGLAPLAPATAVAAAAAPATQLPPNPCSCLSKTRLQDGRIFFQDVCTGDAAVYPATPVAPAPAT